MSTTTATFSSPIVCSSLTDLSCNTQLLSNSMSSIISESVSPITNKLWTSIKNVMPDWPDWALDVLLIMTGLLLVTLFLTSFYTPEDEKIENEKSSKDDKKSETSNKDLKKLHKEFNTFRHNYILVYLVIQLADWMQGTHMYTLYLSYNVNISALFLTGFLSGAIFAPFLGSAVDKFGRKRSCIVYCILEIIINVMEHSTNFEILLVGRVLGGISTNLLFSAFESWMTTQHRLKGYPEEWLQRTYSETSIGNGTMAILAGIIAQVLEDYLGHIGPFQGAIFLTCVALVLVLSWEENYGEVHKGDHLDNTEHSLYKQFIDGWKATLSNSNIWRIGMIQSLSEGAMYTFVFMWVPTLLSMNPVGGVPTGCVFSSMMMAITIGGLIISPVQTFVSKCFVKKGTELTATLVYLLASISMSVPALCFILPPSSEIGKAATAESCFVRVIVSFMIIELCIGMYMPAAGTLRSKYVPDALQGAILNIFRLPLNAFVVAGTYATDVLEPSQCYGLVSVWFFLASLIQLSMIFFTTKDKVVDDAAKKTN